MDADQIVLQALKAQTDERLRQITLQGSETLTEQRVVEMARGVIEHRRNTRSIWSELLIDDGIVEALRFINAG